jgi:hypothetical protein
MTGRPKFQADKVWIVENIEELCEAIASLGTQHKALAKYGKSASALAAVMGENPDIESRVMRARRIGISGLVEETVQLADELEGHELVDPIQVVKLQSANRQWLAARINRAEFGDAPKVALQVNVGDMHLTALRAKALPAPEPAALPAPDVVDIEPLPVGLADLL